MQIPAPNPVLGHTWIRILRSYLFLIAVLNLAWEIVQLPLYALWHEANASTLVYSVLHCTAGDVMIAALAFLVSLLILGNSDWPRERYAMVGAAAVVIGIAYTAYSEWLNVFVRKSWAYGELMPLLPGLAIGLSPLAQWLVVPAVAFGLARRI